MIANVSGYRLGTGVPDFQSQVPGSTLTVTFVVTENCNLACGYCYQVHKNSHSRMSLETAKKCVDFVLDQDRPEVGVVWEFIGGEPLLEITLMNDLSDYIVTQMWLRNHKWLNWFMFSISSNGVLYDAPKVQEFIKKHHEHLSLGISIDGTREKHDMQRIFPNGKGSYSAVAANVALWLKQFPNALTKVTFASDDLPLLKESIVHLWDMGIKVVPANVVFEDVWKEGDDLILEQQLRELADYAIESGRWRTHNCSLFDDNLGGPVSDEELNRNWCGAGTHMIAFDHEGKIFPCIRFMDYSLTNKPPICLGDTDTGIDNDRLRPFFMLTSCSVVMT